jgi:hypothetical protein
MTIPNTVFRNVHYWVLFIQQFDLKLVTNVFLPMHGKVRGRQNYSYSVTKLHN